MNTAFAAPAILGHILNVCRVRFSAKALALCVVLETLLNILDIAFNRFLDSPTAFSNPRVKHRLDIKACFLYLVVDGRR